MMYYYFLLLMVTIFLLGTVRDNWVHFVYFLPVLELAISPKKHTFLSGKGSSGLKPGHQACSFPQTIISLRPA